MLLKRILSFSFILALLARIASPAAAAVLIPDDPLFSEQWYLSKIQAVGAWEITTGSADVVVAVLDTGVDINNPDLAPHIWTNSKEQLNGKDDDGNGFIDDVHGWDFVDNDNDPRPDTESTKLTRTGANHGTILAGVIGAVTGNGMGVAGINWKVRIMPVRVLDSEGVGNTETVEQGIRYAVNNGADIINLSFVGKIFSQSLYNAIFDAWKKGVVVVAAAGNNKTAADLDTDPLYPVCFDGPAGENIVLGVAAADREDKLATFSNFGKKCIDVLAPGVGIFSTQVFVPGNTIFHDSYGGGWSGTSVAAAVTSGVAALIKSYNRDLQAQEIIRLLSENSDQVDQINSGKLGGRGRLNAFLALQATEDYIRGEGRGLIKKGEVIIAPGSVSKNPVRIFEGSGRWIGNIKIPSIDVKGGVNIAQGDINNDGFPEIATVAASGGDSRVRVWQSNGKETGNFLAYEKDFTGGTEIAFANLDGSGSDQIITAPHEGREAEVRIYKADGTLFNKFLAFPESYKGGVNMGIADLDHDGHDEIIIAPRGYYEPVIKIFRPDGILISQFNVLRKSSSEGIQLAVGDLNGDGTIEILTTSLRGNPQIHVWNYLGKELRPAFYLTPSWYRGIILSVGDINNDGKAEIVIGSPRGMPPFVKVVDANLKLKNEFLAFPKNERSGVNIAVVK